MLAMHSSWSSLEAHCSSTVNVQLQKAAGLAQAGSTYSIGLSHINPLTRDTGQNLVNGKLVGVCLSVLVELGRCPLDYCSSFPTASYHEDTA